ncbi:hypothetical protein CRV24_005542 [Beauveria bassiana]|nr:hypothetical protein CRV24_005542 [Beauveria bassiana]KAH8709503.1 hypothetical protein HC256_009423 [Beauveria bassiana]
MPSHISVIPASTRAGEAAIRALLASAQNPHVRAFYRDPSKAPAEFKDNPRFTALQADVGSGSDIDLNGSDAVFYIPPPAMDGTDVEVFAKKSSDAIKSAIKTSSTVTRLLVLSAIAAQNDHGIGVLRLNHLTDKFLASAADKVTIVRPCLFYHMWADAVRTAKQDSPNFVSTIHPADWRVPMVSVRDLGEWSAKQLLDDSKHPPLQTLKFYGPRLVSPNDVKRDLETIVGKEVLMTTIPPEKQAEFWAELVPQEYVQDFVEYQTCQLPGGVAVPDFVYDEHTVRAHTELLDELRELVG